MGLFGKKYLSKADLRAISSAIAEVEKDTAGEIRVVARHRRHKNEKRRSLHDLALQEFHRLGMDRTADRTGVLILLLFDERQFHIVADEGIHRKVKDGTWDAVATILSSHFKDGNYADGIIRAVRETGSLLAQHFPRRADDTNELPNDVVEE